MPTIRVALSTVLLVLSCTCRSTMAFVQTLRSPTACQPTHRRERGSAALRRLPPAAAIDLAMVPVAAAAWWEEINSLSAVVGGAFGVTGTLVVYEGKRLHALERVNCAYCKGTGFIDCAQCLGTGTVTFEVAGDAVDASTSRPMAARCGCEACARSGVVECANCHGSGVSIPDALQRKSEKQIDDEVERLLDEAGAAAYAFERRQEERQTVTARLREPVPDLDCELVKI